MGIKISSSQRKRGVPNGTRYKRSVEETRGNWGVGFLIEIFWISWIVRWRSFWSHPLSHWNLFSSFPRHDLKLMVGHKCTASMEKILICYRVKASIINLLSPSVGLVGIKINLHCFFMYQSYRTASEEMQMVKSHLLRPKPWRHPNLNMRMNLLRLLRQQIVCFFFCY
ncbi:hypothetical protein RchiOBHm_Chr4g0421831 [Rosa chinensis]|uniref:Uncharacterized protein n=1 Tax=Rosa chinensis TaxID=74649 RepID=A0A2P6QY73_ROSCH|nr:hypothetical protein RchiOBHm_Chr4g0421831 [Rosa chinensis]